MGCAERRDSFATHGRFNDSDNPENVSGNAVSMGASRDYSECGKLVLLSAASRMLVETIKDSLRKGGLAFSENFRLDSNIG